jgi:hypothetical protein
VPPLAQVLRVAPPGAAGWAVVAVASLATLVLGQIGLEIARRLGSR